MPTYMDVHRNVTAAPEEIAYAHEMDKKVESKYDVRYTRYWYDQGAGHVYCLVEAPSINAAIRVHKEAHGLLPDDVIEVTPEEVDAFLGEEKRTPSGTDPSDSGLRVVMFTDMFGSTALAGELGDNQFFALLQEHDRLIRDALREHGGREVKHTGDGILASFASATKALACAIAIQHGLDARNTASEGPALRVRVGMTAGEPVESGGDLFGSTVNLAARICAQADAEQVLASAVVQELCLGGPFRFVSLEPVELKGFNGPLQLYEVLWRDP